MLFGYVGTPTSDAAKPIFTEARVPFVGPFTGAELLRSRSTATSSTCARATTTETDAIVELVTKLDLKRIAVFYQNDSYGKAGLKGVERAMKSAQHEDRRDRHRRAQLGRRRGGGRRRSLPRIRRRS